MNYDIIITKRPRAGFMLVREHLTHAVSQNKDLYGKRDGANISSTGCFSSRDVYPRVHVFKRESGNA